MASNLSSQYKCEKFESSAPVQITQIVFLSMIFLLSIVGNTLIIIAVYKRPELRKTVNYFIVNMAVSDFVFPLLTIPATLNDIAAGFWEWPGINSTPGNVLCKIVSFVMSVSLTVSLESLVWIAFDRFVAVVWPMKVRHISSRFRAFAVASTWIVAVVINCLDLYFFGLTKQYDGKMKCLVDPSSLLFTIYTYLRVVLIYIAPMFLLTILYSVTTVTLRRQDKVLQCSVTQRNDLKETTSHQNEPLYCGVILSVLCSFCNDGGLFNDSSFKVMFFFPLLLSLFLFCTLLIFNNKSNHLFYVRGKLPSCIERRSELLSMQTL